MKQLVTYLTENAIPLLIVLGVIAAGVSAEQFATTTKGPDPVVAAIPGETEVSGPSQTPEISCEPVQHCSRPEISVTGQYCKFGRPYTNVEIVYSAEIDMDVPDPATWTDVTYDEQSEIYTIKLPGTALTYYLYYAPTGVTDSISTGQELNALPEHEFFHQSGNAHCGLVRDDPQTHTALINCGGTENSGGYVLVGDSCSCEGAKSLTYVEIPVLACEEAGREDGECPRGQSLDCPLSGGPCYCR